MSGSKGLRYAEGELGGNRASDIMEQQGHAFTEAAMRRAGGGGLATSDNFAALNTRLGQELEGISARNTMRVDPQFGQDVGQTLNRYGRLLDVPQSGTAPRLAARNLGAMIPTALGAAAGSPGGFLGSMAGAAVGAALPRLAGAAMMSRPGQAYLTNQMLAGQMTPQMRAIASLLLTNSSLAAGNHP